MNEITPLADALCINLVRVTASVALASLAYALVRWGAKTDACSRYTTTTTTATSDSAGALPSTGTGPTLRHSTQGPVVEAPEKPKITITPVSAAPKPEFPENVLLTEAARMKPERKSALQPAPSKPAPKVAAPQPKPEPQPEPAPTIECGYCHEEIKSQPISRRTVEGSVVETYICEHCKQTVTLQ